MFEYIYISHYPKLVERKQNLIKQFETNNITNYKFINGIDRNDLITDIIDVFYEKNNINFVKKGKHTDINFSINDYRILKPAEIANYLTHLYIYKDIIENTNYENILILEDDAILHEKFSEISQLISLPKDYDIVYITEGCGLHIPHTKINPDIFFYKMDNYISRTCNGYIVSRNFCNKIITNDEKFNLPIDWELTYLCAKFNLNVYWMEPPIIFEGSHINIYKSSVK